MGNSSDVRRRTGEELSVEGSALLVGSDQMKSVSA